VGEATPVPNGFGRGPEPFTPEIAAAPVGISNSVIPVKADILRFQAVPDPGVRGVTWTIFDSSKRKRGCCCFTGVFFGVIHRERPIGLILASFPIYYFLITLLIFIS